MTKQPMRVAIHGFGRIGRSVLRALFESNRAHEFQVVAINELASIEGMAHLLKYDTTHGRFAFPVQVNGETLKVAEHVINTLHETQVSALPWAELGVDLVLDCTGTAASRADAALHLAAGAKRVLLSHPSSPDVDFTVIQGVNNSELQAQHKVISNGS